jgi:hypothetical protein
MGDCGRNNSRHPRERITEMGDCGCKTRVIPAKAGIHFAFVKSQWIPAFAGMTT